MNTSLLVERLWGNKSKPIYLIAASCILLFTLLGARDLWTQEHRWADIVFDMLYRRDFLHPYLDGKDYYDKPLLSYWLIILVTKVGGLVTTSLRIPSALSGLLALWSIYRIGCVIKNKTLGLLSAWLLLTTFYFIFWARTSSADMLNVAGSLFAIAWYLDHKKQPGFFNYFIFFITIALTSLCKGLVGAIIPFIAVALDLVQEKKSWQRHCCPSFFISLGLASLIYFAPFWASSHFGGETYGESGLYLVYRENILRYFQPFDHQGPWYTYLIYLPLYLMPWTIFLVPTLFTLKKRWQSMTLGGRWNAWVVLSLFLFFTLSGSRRSYYVLPIIPLAILLVGDWISAVVNENVIRIRIAASMVVFFFISFWIMLDLMPAWYYSQIGMKTFVSTLKNEAEKTASWKNWNVVLLDAESKLNFYLQLPSTTPHYRWIGKDREQQAGVPLLKIWPILQNKPKNTIFITRKLYQPLLTPYFLNYEVVEIKPNRLTNFLDHHKNSPIAFLPKIQQKSRITIPL